METPEKPTPEAAPQSPDDLAAELAADAPEPTQATEAAPTPPPPAAVPPPKTVSKNGKAIGRPRKNAAPIPEGKRPKVVVPPEVAKPAAAPSAPAADANAAPDLGPTPDELKRQRAAALAHVMTHSVTGAAVSFLGEDMIPTDKESETMRAAWEGYFLATDAPEPPPWALVLVATASYAAPRLTRPTVRERLALLALKVRGFFVKGGLPSGSPS